MSARHWGPGQEEALVDKWTAATAGGAEEKPRATIRALQEEAFEAAQLLETHWKTTRVAGRTRFALDSMTSTRTLSLDTARELRELQWVFGEAHLRYKALVKRASNAPVERGRELFEGLRTVLSFLLEDGGHPEGEVRLVRLRALHASRASMPALATALEAFAELAEEYQGELVLVPKFPLTTMDQALEAAREIRLRYEEGRPEDWVEELERWRTFRNRIGFAMSQRLSAVQRAFRYVFHDVPEVREAQPYLDFKRRRALS